ncbi:MAG: hypothetical protein KDB24_12415, partial [Microthrixaceae bacterium]|nr:hypothetical protein [Microthrixaceae bacterium]
RPDGVRLGPLVGVAALAITVAFVALVALHVPGLGVDEGAHITHAAKLRQGNLASHDDVMSPELSSVSRCERSRVIGRTSDPGYPIGARTECYTPEQIADKGIESAAQQAQHTPIYYLPLAMVTKVVDRVTTLDPLVDTYRVAGLMFAVLSGAALLLVGRNLGVSPWISAATLLAVAGTSGFVMAHAFVNNDALAIPAGAALLLTARQVTTGRWQPSALLGVAFLVAIAKPTFMSAHVATVLFLAQAAAPATLRWRDLGRGSSRSDWVARLVETTRRAKPISMTVAGLAAGTVAFQMWILAVVPGDRSGFTTFYKSRLFQAAYFQEAANTLRNPLSRETPISFIDPSYGLFSMSVLESAALVGTVLVAFGIGRWGGREAARLGRSAVGAIFLGQLLLFAMANVRGGAIITANTRYLLPTVPFMFGALVLALEGGWNQRLSRLPKAALCVPVVLALSLQAIGLLHTADPRDNNFWTQRQTGVLASFVNDDLYEVHRCLEEGDQVAVMPFMPKLYDLSPGIRPPTGADDYWEPTLPQAVRRAPYDSILDSDLDAVILTEHQLLGYERPAAGRIRATWTRCAAWQSQDLGADHRLFEVYVPPRSG